MELHHIWGRISDSALNAAPLCRKCHDLVTHKPEEHRALLKKTIRFLKGEQYKLVGRDLKFLFLERVRKELAGFKA